MADAAAAPAGAGGLVKIGVALAVLALILSIVALALPPGGPALPAPSSPHFILSSDLLNGSNRWYPSSLIAFQGDSITFNTTNRGIVRHGFTVEGLSIADTIEPGETKLFTASSVSAGLYRYYCQLHDPRHLGGQLWVQSR